MIISIHALREEGDTLSTAWMEQNDTISIHALREEGDYSSNRNSCCPSKFLSTPSARRATHRGA